LLSERQRMARELHDTVLKTLQGLSLEARALGNRTATTTSVKETAQYIEEVCSRTSREIREVIFDLRSENVKTSIGSQISRMLDEWRKNTGISGDFSLYGQDVVMPPEPARQIRNIVSEALTNIQRHASASHVEIVMKASASELNIEIIDDGRGLSRGVDDLYTYVAEGKLGIAGMKERVELLGGGFFMDSNRSGARVSFHIPFPQNLSGKKQTIDEPDNNSHS